MKPFFKNIYYWILVVAIIKLFLLLFFVTDFNVFENHEIALNFLDSGILFYEHDGNIDFNHQFPLFSVVLSGLYFLGAGKLVGVYHILINTITAMLLVRVFNYWGKQFLKKEEYTSVTFIAVILFIAHPLLSYYQLVQIHPLTTDVFFGALVLFFSIQVIDQKSKVWILGLVLGLAILERATLVVFILPYLIYYWKGIVMNFKKVWVLLIVAALVVSPWLIRNYQYNDTVSFTSGLGRYLWVGSLEATSGTNTDKIGRSYYYYLPTEVLARFSTYTTKEQDAIYKQLYKEMWQEDSPRMVLMFLNRMVNFWWFHDHVGAGYSTSIKPFVVVYKFYQALLLMLLFIAIWRFRKRIAPILLLLICFSLLQSLFYVETRHRLVLEPYVLFLALTGVLVVVKKVLKKEKSFTSNL